MGVKNRSDIGEIQVGVSGCQEPVDIDEIQVSVNGCQEPVGHW